VRAFGSDSWGWRAYAGAEEGEVRDFGRER
jgi:hypothetical protein